MTPLILTQTGVMRETKVVLSNKILSTLFKCKDQMIRITIKNHSKKMRSKKREARLNRMMTIKTLKTWSSTQERSSLSTKLLMKIEFSLFCLKTPTPRCPIKTRANRIYQPLDPYVKGLNKKFRIFSIVLRRM